MREKLKKAPYLLFLLVMPVLGSLYNLLNSHSSNPTNLLTKFDSYIPFMPFFILPYILWYGFILVYLVYLCFKDTKIYVKTLTVIVVGELLCFITYFFFQTTVSRPPLEGKGMLIDLVQIIYGRDLPYNCFPSIHVLTTLAIMLGCLHVKNKHIFHSISIHFTGIMIIISTVFVKQHVILDVFGSLFLALFTYGIVFELFQFHWTKKSDTMYLKE